MKYKTKRVTVTCSVCGGTFVVGHEEILALSGLNEKQMHPLTTQKFSKHMDCSVSSGINPDQLFKFQSE